MFLNYAYCIIVIIAEFSLRRAFPMAMQCVYMRKAYTMNTMHKYEYICSLVPPAHFGLCYVSTRQRGGVDQERWSPRNPRVYVVVFIGCNKSCILLFARLLVCTYILRTIFDGGRECVQRSLGTGVQFWCTKRW